MKNAAIFLLWLICSCNTANDKKPVAAAPNDSNAITTSLTDHSTTISPVRLTKEQIPAHLAYKGILQEAFQWKDRLGSNLLIASLMPPFADKEKNEWGEKGTTAEVYVFHFIKKNDNYDLLWKISDAEKACPFDLTLTFFKEAITITDLDADGIAETSIQYKKACRSDVSPAFMKLIMHEDTVKYSLRGAMWVFDGGNGQFEITEKDVNLEKLPKPKGAAAQMYQQYGRYETEKEFATAPTEFLHHARKQWLKYAKETFD